MFVFVQGQPGNDGPIGPKGNLVSIHEYINFIYFKIMSLHLELKQFSVIG